MGRPRIEGLARQKMLAAVLDQLTRDGVWRRIGRWLFEIPHLENFSLSIFGKSLPHEFFRHIPRWRDQKESLDALSPGRPISQKLPQKQQRNIAAHT